MEYEKELRESGEYTEMELQRVLNIVKICRRQKTLLDFQNHFNKTNPNLETLKIFKNVMKKDETGILEEINHRIEKSYENKQTNMLLDRLQDKLIKHHKLYRYPVKGEYSEDIWDQCINPDGSQWTGGGHQPGADTCDEINNISYQNKSGQINNNYVEITSHRLAKQAGPTLEDKLNFISKKHCDKYVLLSRDEKEWNNGIKAYYLMVFDSKLLDFRSLEWGEHIPTRGPKKGKHNGGYIGKGDPLKFSAKIDGPGTSNQLKITINIDYIGGYTKIIIP